MKITKQQRAALSDLLRKLGRLGGQASAKVLTPAQRSAKARRAGQASGKARRNRGAR